LKPLGELDGINNVVSRSSKPTVIKVPDCMIRASVSGIPDTFCCLRAALRGRRMEWKCRACASAVHARMAMSPTRTGFPV
jgi:hypothetical protein